MSTPEASRAVLITGAPGVGKSEVAPRVAEALPGQVAVIDLDALGAIRPWRADPDVLGLIAANFGLVLGEYLRWGQRSFVVVGVMVPGKLYDAITDYLTRFAVNFVCYGLVAEPEEIARRITGDRRFRDTSGRLADIPLNELITTIQGVQLVDTSGAGPSKVADAIVHRELAFASGAQEPR